ncbi:MAG: OB-fold domain-containing protein [Leptospiraceae bacterium]|nr:OB-fold domain-containing protein [Leptospiraceae bacterium]MCB1199735.1 OB-fold domain-containing protein [Leptospiraceae bacterium]
MSNTIPSMKCSDCGTVHPTGIAICPNCGSEKIAEHAGVPLGEVFTFSVNTFVPAGKFKTRAPYIIAVVKTDENMFMTAVVDSPDPMNIKIGDKVVFKEYEDELTPVFTLAAS